METIRLFNYKYNELIKIWNSKYGNKIEVTNLVKRSFNSIVPIEELLFGYTLPNYPILNLFVIEDAPLIEKSRIFFANDVTISGRYVFMVDSNEVLLLDDDGSLLMACSNSLENFILCMIDALDVEMTQVVEGDVKREYLVDLFQKNISRTNDTKYADFLRYVFNVED